MTCLLMIAFSTCGRIDLQCRSIGESQKCPSMPSSAGKNGEIAGPAFVVEGCPLEDIFVQTRQKEINVSWEEPAFLAIGGHQQIACVEQNLKPGQVWRAEK